MGIANRKNRKNFGALSLDLCFDCANQLEAFTTRQVTTSLFVPDTSWKGHGQQQQNRAADRGLRTCDLPALGQSQHL